MKGNAPEKLGNVIRIDEARLRDYLGELVRETVEESLNQLLDAEAEQLVGAKCYELTEAKCHTRAGHYRRKLQTKAREVSLRVPKLRKLRFESAIIER